MPRSFFYRINAAEFFAITREFSDKELAKWIRIFAADLVAGNSKDEFTIAIIDEAKKFKEKKSLNGKKGMASRYKKANDVITEG